ncbi:hypothetical protein [Nocardioides sp. cx-173]|uniref:hypothetical protein n=1 Tax=Nocardioides sp. cx-173 TaxID=2898796 RepID=UPI001E3F0946|nr:hypothetical protein [Nocardioides sp. cx-173]MCD4523479.1 hypothetical protein [Nocardioides sp. cx-173]UGB42182.1 hypothetical protein LQ940_01320 [Nocardioides sp. cx-173]
MPVEDEVGLVPDLATATTNTYREADGSLTLQSFTERVNYQDEDDSWVPIENELVSAPGAAYEVMNAANSFETKIPSDPSVTPVRFEAEGAWVTMRMHGLDDASPAVDGAEATFDDVDGADEVTYAVTNSGLKEDILLESAPSTSDPALEYTYSLDASAGITPVMAEEGSIEFRDAAGDVKVLMPVAYMFDSAAPDPAFSYDVDYDLAPTGSGWEVTVTPDMDWLLDPARVYPVTVDPSLAQEPPSKDCWIRDSTPTGSNCGDASTFIKVGRSTAPATFRGLLDFNTSSIPTNADISYAGVAHHRGCSPALRRHLEG